MLGENKVSDRKYRTLTASSGHQDDIMKEMNAHAKPGDKFCLLAKYDNHF